MIDQLRELGKRLQDEGDMSNGEAVMNAADLLIAADKALDDMARAYATVLRNHGYDPSSSSLTAAQEFRFDLNKHTGYVTRRQFPAALEPAMYLKVGLSGHLKVTKDVKVRNEWKERGCGDVYGVFPDV